jgi:hypothetical protein
MNLEEAKDRARAEIKELARSKAEEKAMLSGMLILEDAINGDI